MSVKTNNNKHAAFGLTVDLLGAAIKGLVLYNVLLLTGFWGYQDGCGAFQPLFYLLVIPLTILYAYIYSMRDGRTFILMHIGVLAVWCGLSWFASANQSIYILTGVIAAAESVLYKWIIGDSDTKRHIKRFKLQNYYKWGVLIWLISMLLYIQPSGPTEAFPLSVSVCASYMTFSFICYLVLIVMMDYTFQQYDYFRQRQGTDQNTFRQIRHTNKIVAVLLSVLITFSMFGANETIVRLASRAVQLMIDFLIGCGFFGLTKLTKQEYQDGAGLLLPSGNARIDGAGNSLFAKRIFFAIGLVVISILIPLLLYKLYKNIAANYEIGEDKAEYIPKQEKNNRLHFPGSSAKKPGFGSDNNSRIRKLYYKIMNARMDKNRMELIHGKTPKELARIYGKPAERNSMAALTAYYEKARYSDEQCTNSEVQTVKDLNCSQQD